MKYQRITINPLARITRPTDGRDGHRLIWDTNEHGETPGELPDGEAYVPINPRPQSGTDYDQDRQRVERSLTTEADGWQILDLTEAEIEDRVASEASEAEAQAQSIAQQKVAAAKKEEERTRVVALSDADALQEPAELFPPFEIGKSYQIDDRFSWRGTLYKVRQAHTSAVQWLPSENLALYNVVSFSNEWEAGVAYEIGDERDYEGSSYRAIQAHTSQAVFPPPIIPAIWELIT